MTTPTQTIFAGLLFIFVASLTACAPSAGTPPPLPQPSDDPARAADPGVLPAATDMSDSGQVESSSALTGTEGVSLSDSSAAIQPIQVSPPLTATGKSASSGSQGTKPAVAPEVDVARRAFAAAKHVAPEDVKVVSAELVTWSDGSLGCPQPGMAYIQVLTPGYKVVLEAAGETAEYHTGTGQTVQLIRCMQSAGPGRGEVQTR